MRRTQGQGGFSCFLFLKAMATIFAATAIASHASHAYTPTVASNGTAVRWQGEIKLNLAGNPKNFSGLSDSDFRRAVVRSLQRWKNASGGAVNFDYWQGANDSVYEPNSNYNGLSSIYFGSHASADPHLTANVLGLTQVWYNTENGKILEADIVLNDKDFRFTTDERDTSGYGSGGTSFNAGKSSVFIENVITHELGHALGLSHSGGLQSTMLFMESPEQAHLGCDESVAIHALYPTSDDRRSRGTLRGSVVSPSGAPIFGAHVLAISRRRGTTLATAMTDSAGRFEFSALEPGVYFLMAEPFYGGSQALPSFYSAMNTEICSSNQFFGRTVLTTSPGSSTAFGSLVAAGQNTTAPPLQVKCSPSLSGATISALSGATTFTSAPLIYDGSQSAEGAGGFGVSDRLSSSGTAYYKMNHLSGNLEAHVVAYSLYSPIRTQVELLDSYGNVVDARVAETVYSGASGFKNFDSAVYAEALPSGDYTLRVSASSLTASYYPAGPISLDSVPFILVTGSVNEADPSLASSLATNARCRQDESAFAAYVSPPGNPPRAELEDDQGGVGFCGTISRQDGDDSRGSGGPGPSAAAIISWFAPWLFMLAAVRLLRLADRAA